MDSSDNKKYVVFKKNGRLGNAIFRYLACSLFCMKYNFEFILEDDYNNLNRNNNYIFYKGLDQVNNDINYINNKSIDELKDICNKNINYSGNAISNSTNNQSNDLQFKRISFAILKF
jgi:hypothetical protein